MATRRIIPTIRMNSRRLWLEKLGGIDTVSVQNKEWMILLKEDTRNSLMIEGYFVSKAVLAAAIENPKYTDTGYKILGYFDAAVSAYELAFQQYKTGEYRLTKPIIRQMHSMLFRGDPNFMWKPGEWRKAPIEITGATVRPSEPFAIERHIEHLIEVANKKEENVVRKAAFVHDLFEQIHPFPDGNGRVGRILMNFILVAHGMPNIAIKGNEKDRKIYIEALEEADPLVAKIHAGEHKNDLFGHPLVLLEDLIGKSLAAALDVVICGRFAEGKSLMSLSEVARVTGKSLPTIRVMCSQKKIICTKINGIVMTHPDLFTDPQ